MRPYRPDRDRDRGQAAVEYVGMLALLLFAAMAAVQLGLAVYAAQQAGTASRAAARAVSQDGERDAGAAGRAAVSDWLTARFTPSGGGDEVTVTAEVDIPSVLPGIDFGSVTRSTTMPTTDTPTAAGS